MTAQVFSTRLIAYLWLPCLVIAGLASHLNAPVGDSRTVFAAALTGGVICVIKRMAVGGDNDNYGTDFQILLMGLVNSVVAAMATWFMLMHF